MKGSLQFCLMGVVLLVCGAVFWGRYASEPRAEEVQASAAEEERPVPEVRGVRTWGELLGRMDAETLVQWLKARVEKIRVVSPDGAEGFEMRIAPHWHWHAGNEREAEERSVMVKFTREGVRWAGLKAGSAVRVPEAAEPERLTPWAEFDSWLDWLVARNQGWHRFVVFCATEDCPFSEYWRYFHALFTRFPEMEESHWEIIPSRIDSAEERVNGKGCACFAVNSGRKILPAREE